MRLLVLGAGAIGGYFGGRLAASGADVTFLVRPGRARALERDGLRITSECGDAALQVRLTGSVTAEDAFDLVLLSCKAFDLLSAMEVLRPLAGRTAILPLLNGLAHYPLLDGVFGADHVLGGLAQIMVALSPDGTVVHGGTLHQLTYGTRHDAQHDICDRVASMFAAAPFDARRSADILQDGWEKFAFITAAASLTSLMRSAVGPIVASRDGAGLAVALLRECAQVAAAEGRPIRPKAHEGALRTLTQPGSPFKASMLRDIEAGQPVEADQLQGDMVRRGERHGIELPFVRVALAHLHAYLQNREAVPSADAGSAPAG